MKCNKDFNHDVIVCVHNGLDEAKACLDSIVKFWDPAVTQRLIIVNDCSDSNTTKYLNKFKSRYGFVSVIKLSAQHYYTKAANIGLKASDAEVRTLLNSDTIVTENWARKIQRVFAMSDLIGIVGPLSNAASTQSVPFVKNSENQTAINPLPVGVSIDAFARFVEEAAQNVTIPFVPLIHGFCFTIRSCVLDKIGYFDGQLFPRGYGEENDFCFRAEDAGFILAIALDTFIFHAKSKSYVSSDRIQFMRKGMEAFRDRYGDHRIKQAVTFMEKNPYLQSMRDAVLSKWDYGVDSDIAALASE